MTRRLLLSYLALTVIVLVVLEAPLAWFFADRERRGILTDLERDAVALATRYEDTLQHGTPYTPAAAESYSAATGARVVVVDRFGIALLDTDGEPSRDFSTRPEIAAALAGEAASGSRRSETLGTDLYYAAVPVASGGAVFGAVRVSVESAQVSARVRGFLGGLGIIGVAVLAAMSLISWVVARSFARPVQELSAVAAAVAEGDLGARAAVGDAPPEIAEVATTFNEMAARVADLIEHERRFVADASHQLRTPLTALRLRLEAMEDAPGSDRADVEAAIAETERLAALVDQLLLLARSEREAATHVPVDVSAAVRERTELWAAVAEEAETTLVVDAPERPVLASAVDGCVEQVLDNYLANALAAGPRGGAVTLLVREEADRVEIRVRDEGPGLDDESKERAFERFWRGGAGHPGTGLGLAIVRTLAEASGGSARLEDAPGGGIDAVLSLPRV